MPRFETQKHEKQSKGRNGWFHPAMIAVLHGPHDTVAVEVWSKRQDAEPPIDLYLTWADAAKLGRELLGAAGGSDVLTYLKERFPWLGTDEDVNGADVIDSLNSLYFDLGGKPDAKG